MRNKAPMPERKGSKWLCSYKEFGLIGNTWENGRWKGPCPTKGQKEAQMTLCFI